MTPSDWIEVLGIIASLITSIVAIAISLKTLQQNSKMMEESTRPVLAMYSVMFKNVTYIVIKNFGSSPCTISGIKSGMNITKEENQPVVGNPYAKLKGAVVPPNGSIKLPLISARLKKKVFKFEIMYKSQTRSYTDNFTVDMNANNAMPVTNTTATEPEKAIEIIANSIEDIKVLHI